MHLEQMNGIFDGVHNTIADYILSTVAINGYTTQMSLVALSKAILPLYQQAVAKGYPVYRINDGASNRTVEYVASEAILPKSVVLNYLAALEELSLTGRIDLAVWNPQIPTGKGDLGSAVVAGISTGFNRLLLAGSLVAIVYLFGRPFINKFLDIR